MAQAAASHNTSISRRTALAACAGVAVAPLSPPDPALAAIAHLRRAEAEYDAALDRGEREATLARRRCDRAAVALLSTIPTTRTGLAALLCFIRRNQEQGLTCECRTFLRTVEALGAPALDAMEA